MATGDPVFDALRRRYPDELVYPDEELQALCARARTLRDCAAALTGEFTDDAEAAFDELIPDERTAQALLPGASWGAGFGLPLAQHIVQLHGGTMMISRKEAGAGAMAVFSIPLGEPDPQAVKSPIAGMDYAGGFRHELVELADVLPLEVFDSSNVN